MVRKSAEIYIYISPMYLLFFKEVIQKYINITSLGGITIKYIYITSQLYYLNKL